MTYSSTDPRRDSALAALQGDAWGGTRVVRIAPNPAAAPRDSRFGQNELLGDSVIPRIRGCQPDREGISPKIESMRYS